MEDSFDFCKSEFDDSCRDAAKGLSQSMDSPNLAGKSINMSSQLDGMVKLKEIMMNNHQFKLKGCVSEKRYNKDGEFEEIEGLIKITSQPQGKHHIDFETGNNYHHSKHIQDFDVVDPRLDSFEDFLKTNNYFDFSMNGIFEDGNGHQTYQKPHTETPDLGLPFENEQISPLKLKSRLVSASMEVNESYTYQSPSPLGILNKFRSAEKKLCGAALNQNFKKDKNKEAKIISVLQEDEQPNYLKKFNFGMTQEPVEAEFQNKRSNPGSMKNIIKNQELQSSRSNCGVRLLEQSMSCRTSESRPSMQLEDMLRGIPQSAPSTSSSYRFVSEVYRDSSKYEGYQLHGKKHGLGTLVLADESRYEGDWKNNMMSGIGKLTYQNGSLAYEGGFLDNKIHGHGVMVNQEAGMVIPKNPIDYRNFSTVNKRWLSFEGIFNNGKKEGPGKWTFATGEVFSGNFSNDMVSGVGRFLTEDRVIFGIWFNNIFIKSLNS